MYILPKIVRLVYLGSTSQAKDNETGDGPIACRVSKIMAARGPKTALISKILAAWLTPSHSS